MTSQTGGRDLPTGLSTDVKRPLAASAEGLAGLILLYAENAAALPSGFLFASETLSLGREASNDCVLEAQGVSRKHVEFARQKEGWSLRDLGSRNGTLVDGSPVTQTLLEGNEIVRIGDAIFKYLPRDAEAYLPFRLDAPESRNRIAPELVGGYQIDRVASSLAKIAQSDLSCLILGETGTGKEVVAQALHRLSNRPGQFQAINCAAIPEPLLESELFGYRKGAFSGATRDKPGLFHLADRGTLLLDEMGDMPLPAQAKLLRVLQTREVFPLGGTAAESVDVRVVAATHRDLATFVNEGRFRGDLYARINECAVRLPPLRERKEDIYPLVRAFYARHAGKELAISFRAMAALLHYDWPYNVRELESCIRAAVTLAAGASIEVEHLPDAVVASMEGYGKVKPAASAATAGQRERQETKRDVAPPEAEFRALVARHQGNISAIARELGKDRVQVHRWLKRYGLSTDKIRGE